jgi:hypothetical protein
MSTLAASTTKGRQSQAATSARSSAERMSGSWLVLLGSETVAPCHAFIGRNIAEGLDSRYVPAGGSS